MLKIPFTVVLTGGIASGKTTVADIFSEKGVPVIDTDIIARDLVAPGSSALAEIREAFGKGITHADGTLDRTSLRRLIFADSQSRVHLESILHPRIKKEVLAQISELDTAYCILVIPLFSESSDYKWVNRVLVVDVPEAIQLERLIKRDKGELSQAKAILKAQSKRHERLLLADDIIENSGDVSELDQKVEQLHQKYLVLSSSIC